MRLTDKHQTSTHAMTHYLQIRTSLFGESSQSSRLADRFVRSLAGSEPDAAIVVRDLAREPLPHLDADRFTALGTPPEGRSPEQARIVAESDALVAELQAADVVVIALPMYNFGVPSTLKAYFDHVARAGVTFRYTESGPEGLLRGKRAYVFATRGGRYAGTPQDLQTGYVRQFLAFVGITDVEFVYAEGLALGDDARASALADADRRIDQLAA